MSTIISQIILALSLLYGAGNYTQKAQKIYNDNGFTVQKNGVVIIDADEL